MLNTAPRKGPLFSKTATQPPTCSTAVISWCSACTKPTLATGDRHYRDMEDKLIDFLVRIQITSEKHPELDGGWFRAFDYRKWDYWGSNAGAGWGVWTIEAGWTQAWIPTTLALHELDVSLWDLTKHSRAAKHWQKYRKQMLPDEAIQPPVSQR